MFKFSGKRPASLGAKNGKLAPVVNKPNNVSSQADVNDWAHYVAPLKFTGDAAGAFQKLLKISAVAAANQRGHAGRPIPARRVQLIPDGLRGRCRVRAGARAESDSRALGGSARLFRSRSESQTRRITARAFRGQIMRAGKLPLPHEVHIKVNAIGINRAGSIYNYSTRHER